jgi:hypothetical protein
MLATPASTPLQPARKQWYDKLADALLGDDEEEGRASSRYALICEKCFTHNGLVKESMWEDARECLFSVQSFSPSDFRNTPWLLDQSLFFRLCSATKTPSFRIHLPEMRTFQPFRPIEEKRHQRAF